jgi:GTP-binding protein HflX
VLGKVGAGEIPVVYVVNKVDQMSEEAQATLRAHLPDALLVSSRSTADVTKVRNEIISFFDKEMTEVELMIPFAKAALRSEICATGRVISESFDEQGGLLKVLADEQSIRRWKSQLE